MIYCIIDSPNENEASWMQCHFSVSNMNMAGSVNNGGLDLTPTSTTGIPECEDSRL